MARKDGKIIDTIRHLSNGVWFDIPLRMTKDNSSLRGTTRYSYAVDMDSPSVRLTGDDPTKVIVEAKAAIDRHTSITWERFLHVVTKVTTGTGHGFARSLESGKYADVMVHFRAVMVGTDCAGKTCHIVLDRIDSEFDPSRTRDLVRGALGTATGKPSFEDGVESSALIPFTDDNVAKLTTIVDGLRRLGEMVTDLMQHDKIAGSLATVSKTLNIGHRKG